MLAPVGVTTLCSFICNTMGNTMVSLINIHTQYCDTGGCDVFGCGFFFVFVLDGVVIPFVSFDDDDDDDGSSVSITCSRCGPSFRLLLS